MTTPTTYATEREAIDSAIAYIRHIAPQRPGAVRSTYLNVLNILGDHLARIVPPPKPNELLELVESWEQIGRSQRQLANSERDIGLRASLIASSNAWMTAADDLKKHIKEKT